MGSRGPRSLSSVTSGVDRHGTDAESEALTETQDTTTTRFVSECVLPTSRGSFHLRAYKHEGNGRSLEPVVMVAVSFLVLDFSCGEVLAAMLGCGLRRT